MPYPAHTLVTVGGHMNELAASDEIWQFGIRGFADGGGPIDPAHLGNVALHILRGPTGSGGGMEGIWTDPKGFIPTDAKLEWCKAVNVGPDGKYTSEPGIAQMTAKAGAASASVPSFLCVAISWTTGKSLGKACRGRIYPPNYGVGLSTGATTTALNTQNIRDWGIMVLQAFDTSLATDPSEVFHPYVVSSSGQSNVITGVRVGNVFDSQRRRKDKHPEVYVSAAFTP